MPRRWAQVKHSTICWIAWYFTCTGPASQVNSFSRWSQGNEEMHYGELRQSRVSSPMDQTWITQYLTHTLVQLPRQNPSLGDCKGKKRCTVGNLRQSTVISSTVQFVMIKLEDDVRHFQINSAPQVKSFSGWSQGKERMHCGKLRQSIESNTTDQTSIEQHLCLYSTSSPQVTLSPGDHQGKKRCTAEGSDKALSQIPQIKLQWNNT